MCTGTGGGLHTSLTCDVELLCRVWPFVVVVVDALAGEVIVLELGVLI